MLLHSNWGKILITNKAQAYGYKSHVWFNQKPITNSISLRNIIKQYSFTCDNLDDMLIFHLEEHGKHNIYFRIRESGLH